MPPSPSDFGGNAEPRLPAWRTQVAPPALPTVPEPDAVLPDVPRRDFVDPALVAGRSIGVWVYVLALLLAALADFGNFFQIIQFAMPSQQNWLLFVIVVGFTACVLFLAHCVGVILRLLRAGENWIPAYFAVLAAAAWLLLGGAGLYLRLTNADPQGRTGTVEVVGQGAAATAAETAGQAPVLGASLVFLGLYIGTGLVAMIGAYLTHQPAHAAFAKSRKEHDKAVAAAAEAARSLAEARANVEMWQRRSAIADVIRWADEVELLNVGEELKKRARTSIAERAQDAALTEVYLPEEA
ncbi:hypothetical protein ACFQO7_22335 [Catellatospora aurea]|uniref:Uncharacterized protein n=1 Tax=Catellatospora aurea TaxID=1337874 RepID=A0ABW2H3P8_9ACTN